MNEYDTDRLLNLAAMASDIAVREGAEQADVFAGNGRGTTVDLEKSAIKSSDVKIGGSISVRAFYRGGVGYSSTDRLDDASVVEAAKSAAQLAKLAEPDPDFVSLPGPAEYDDVPGLFDPKVADMGVSDVIGMCIENIDGAKAVTGEANVSGGASVSSRSWALANSLGVRAAGRSSSISLYTMVIIKHGDDVGTFYDFDQARLLSDFDPSGVGKSAAETALKFLGSRKIETGDMPVVLGPFAGISVFGAITSAANAEDIQRGRSFLIGKKGQKIGSDIIRIIDDPFIPGGLSSRRCDAEGVPSQRTMVVEGGVLVTYLHNSYTANKAKEPNTGHGTRGGISPTNLVPKLGEKSSQEIIKEVERGLYINQGSLSPNRITGEVSASVDFGFVIENGELVYPVKNTMVGGNFLEMLNNLDAVSSDYRYEPGLILPTVRIVNASVAGGK